MDAVLVETALAREMAESELIVEAARGTIAGPDLEDEPTTIAGAGLAFDEMH